MVIQGTRGGEQSALSAIEMAWWSRAISVIARGEIKDKLGNTL